MGDMLMGGSEKGTSEPKDLMTEQQERLLDRMANTLSKQIYGPKESGPIGVPAYGGSLTAAPSDLQKTSWGEIEKLLNGGMQDRSATSQTAIDKILQGTTNVPQYDVGEFDTAAIQDWYKNALVNPAMKTWEQDVVPTIQEKFIANNAGSSGAGNRAISGSAQKLMSDLNAQMANTLFGEKQAFDTRKFDAGMQGTQNQFAAGQSDLERATQVPGMNSQDLQDFMASIGMGSTAGATQRGIEQEGLNEQFQKWLSSQPYANPWLTQFFQPTIGAATTENVVFPGTQSAGLMQTLIGPVAGAYAGSDSGSSAISSWSSKRFKKNIVPVGEEIAGIQPVEFEYTDDAIRTLPGTSPGRKVGFIAEEVAEKFPEAVVFDSSGQPAAIRYGQLFELMGV